ncbi:MAG: methyltransferase domain-containing protein [Magnetococcales bacterium]|nr:methyltransferase domain-containing protein [Magnetococcales bacterium]
MIDPRFLELLCCPACRGELIPGSASPGNGCPAEPTLDCTACGHAFPVMDGIPVLLLQAVGPERAGLFQRYWDSAAQAALYDDKVEGGGSLFGTCNHLSEMEAITTLYEPANLDLVLDAGCGNGRFMETFPPQARKVGVDASLNLLRIARRRGRGDFHVCCELERLPFRSGVFGTVVSCRVLQHLQAQETAVAEMARIIRPGGNLLIQVYNFWNLKTLYKALRQSPVRRVLNAPFRLLFRSMSPFDAWGLDYDHYNSWWQLKTWMARAGMTRLTGRGAGFGFHKYFLQPFYVDAILAKQAPGLLQRYYQGCLALERRIGHWPVVRHLLEKVVLKGTALPAGQVETGLVDKGRRTLRHHLRNTPWANRAAWQELRRERTRPQVTGTHRWHLAAALDWLRRAQDATPDGGVSRGYAMGWSEPFQGRGWQPAYPETTGYLIPTLFDCAARLDQPDLARRALAMADWEIAIQMPSGAVMGGTLPPPGRIIPPTPAIFNTGQVLLGWERAYRETGAGRFLDAAARAARFLVAHQSADGAWRRGNSRFADASATTYNARVGWALIRLGRTAGAPAWQEAGLRNLRYTLARQRDNGWFEDNCLSDPRHPLLHTLCYAMEGLLGGAELLEDAAWLAAVQRPADHLLERLSPEGRLPGRLDAQWRGTVDWDCLTGSAQLAGIWLTLARLTGEERYREPARRVLRFLKGTQNCTTPHPGLRGGIKGSYPFDGGYGRLELLNWAAKFFVDGLLLDGL